MAYISPISHSQAFIKQPIFCHHTTRHPSSSSSDLFRSFFVPRNISLRFQVPVFRRLPNMPLRSAASSSAATVVVASATTGEKPKKRYLGEGKGFVEEMRFVSMKLHTTEQAKGGEKKAKQPEEQAVPKWEPSVEGYLKFLVDSKLVYDALEEIVDKAAYPSYAEFRNTGLERSERLAKDLEWFKEQGHYIPEPSPPGVTYAQHLKELSEKDPQAFICHFYNVYFAHSAGGRMIGKKVAEKILNERVLEFFKWDGDLSQLLQNVKDKLNKVTESWTREEKNHCLEETEKSFKYSGNILRLILS